MKTILATMAGCALLGIAWAAGSAGRITPGMQSTLDAQKKVVASWAASPVLVTAVKAQNEKGAIPGMTNRKWSSLKTDDPVVSTFEKNAAGVWLTRKLEASNGMLREAFLNAANGEKVAFAEKPSSYIHTGTPKFDMPMKKGVIWQGDPEWDKSSRSYAVQISAPVRDHGRPIGVLVVGVSMKMVKTTTPR